ncbi:MAG: hypothetical protein KatS3mg124_0841 [Porticoccaceae bacterium]|nr:MAG: hypothetical protein KatS3mg124_0841 [Porticoccaceae bacterium]
MAAVLTAWVGSIGDNRLGGWYSYRAAKAAANQIVRTAALELARTHRQAALVALHPGTVDTPFTAAYREYQKLAVEILRIGDNQSLHRRLSRVPKARPRRGRTGARRGDGGARPRAVGRFFRPPRRGSALVAPRLVLVLGDQLTETIAALAVADRARALVVMAEVAAEATYVRLHPQKIALVFAAMRKFAARLAARGWRVAYTRLDDPQ